jgi:hypothetical protein
MALWFPGSYKDFLSLKKAATLPFTTWVYGQAQLRALFYCLDYATKSPCETQASGSSLSDDKGGTPPPLEPMRGRFASAVRTSEHNSLRAHPGCPRCCSAQPRCNSCAAHPGHRACRPHVRSACSQYPGRLRLGRRPAAASVVFGLAFG